MERNDREAAERRGAKRVDDWLRRGLGADRGTVERLVRRALNSEPREQRPGIAMAAVVAMVALAATALVLYPGFRERIPAASREARVSIPTITNESGTVEVLYPPPRASAGTRGPCGPSRSGPYITVFNSDGLIAAIVPTPMTRHFILGGQP